MRITKMLGASSWGWLGVGHHGADSGPCHRSFPQSFVLLHRTPFDHRSRYATYESDYGECWIMLEITSRSGHDAGPRTEIAIAPPRSSSGRFDDGRARANSARKTPDACRPRRCIDDGDLEAVHGYGFFALHQHRATARAVTHDDSGSTGPLRECPQNHPTIPHRQ